MAFEEEDRLFPLACTMTQNTMHVYSRHERGDLASRYGREILLRGEVKSRMVEGKGKTGLGSWHTWILARVSACSTGFTAATTHFNTTGQERTAKLMSPCVASQPYLGQDGLAKQLCPGAGALQAGLGYPNHQDGPPLSIPALPSHLHNNSLDIETHDFACKVASRTSAILRIRAQADKI
ncbi:MAG: hypothetical protein FRX49_02901 [Trebouxia sp. A1-2]|nr:MAG: hypothetical protein FRX49_02901 [Trebouxia sp. A1-2]